jgi:hypothetical protein
VGILSELDLFFVLLMPIIIATALRNIADGSPDLPFTQKITHADWR